MGDYSNIFQALISPTPEQLKILNAQLQHWAAEHSNVHILPLSRWVDGIRAGEPLLINGKKLSYKVEELFCNDQVHTTLTGSAILIMKILDELPSRFPSLNKSCFILEKDALFTAVRKNENRKLRMRKAQEAQEANLP